MKARVSAWLLATALLLSGCHTLGQLEAPEVSVTGINLNSFTLFEQEWGLTLRARNPNDRELTLKSLDYEIYVNGEKFARGLTGDTVTLPAMGDAKVTTTITTSLMSSLQQLQKKDGEWKNLKLFAFSKTYENIRKHTNTYENIRKRTKTYENIRKHAKTYGNI